MNRQVKIGELLSRMVPLSGHDVEEILQEQSSNRRRFGAIALSWGLCRPEHVWDAWCQQSADHGDLVDLDKIGVDAQAAAQLPADIARQLGMVPVRVATDAALIATFDSTPEHANDMLSGLLSRRIKFIKADREQLLRVIETYYPTTIAQAG